MAPPFGRGNKREGGVLEINDTEAGFNKAGTEEEKEGGGTRVIRRGSRRGDRTTAMASEGSREVGDQPLVHRQVRRW